jgi:hypothetical protein
MLDTQAKRRIDDCRNILVGKLPNPKTQIEQINIGLIYKFMNHMNKESVELGGKANIIKHIFLQHITKKKEGWKKWSSDYSNIFGALKMI